MPFDQLHRRDFIALLGGAAVAWPLAAQEQPAERRPLVGYLIETTKAWLGLVAAEFNRRKNPA